MASRLFGAYSPVPIPSTTPPRWLPYRLMPGANGDVCSVTPRSVAAYLIVGPWLIKISPSVSTYHLQPGSIMQISPVIEGVGLGT